VVATILSASTGTITREPPITVEEYRK